MGFIFRIYQGTGIFRVLALFVHIYSFQNRQYDGEPLDFICLL